MNSSIILILPIMILFGNFLYLDAIKIGISNPPPTSQTIDYDSTAYVDVTTSTVTASSLAPITLAPVTATAKSTDDINPSSETEWPEFPPRKNKELKTTTNKPLTTIATPQIIPTSTIATNLSDAAQPLTTSKPVALDRPNILGFCECDLSFKSCDINCCCDQDCDPVVLKVFECMDDNLNSMPKLEDARFKEPEFAHGIPSCRLNDGWLCVFRTNLQSSVNEKEINIPKNINDLNLFTWAEFLTESDNEIQQNRQHFTYGESIKIFNIKTKAIENFDLPTYLTQPYCQISQPIYHLISSKRSCLVSSRDELTETVNRFLKFQEINKILIKPSTNTQEYGMNMLLGNISVIFCNETIMKCKIHESATNVTEIENSLLSKVKIIIHHNYTNVQEAIIELWHTDDIITETEEFNDLQEYWIKYEIEFKEFKLFPTDVSKLFTHHFSGPLGYLQGHSIIVAAKMPLNDSLPLSSENSIFNYFKQIKRKINTLPLLAKQNGLCKRKDTSKTQINFGINSATHCKIHLISKDISAKTNFTELCLNFQKLVDQQLFADHNSIDNMTQLYVSELGKPQNDTKKWLLLQEVNAEFTPVIGQYLENSNSFVCRNMLLNLKYNFFIGWYKTATGSNQAFVKQANLNYGLRNDLEFSLDEVLEVPISVTVRFYNLNELAAASAFINLSNLKLIYFSFILLWAI